MSQKDSNTDSKPPKSTIFGLLGRLLSRKKNSESTTQETKPAGAPFKQNTQHTSSNSSNSSNGKEEAASASASTSLTSLESKTMDNAPKNSEQADVAPITTAKEETKKLSPSGNMTSRLKAIPKKPRTMESYVATESLHASTTQQRNEGPEIKSIDTKILKTMTYNAVAGSAMPSETGSKEKSIPQSDEKSTTTSTTPVKTRKNGLAKIDDSIASLMFAYMCSNEMKAATAFLLTVGVVAVCLATAAPGLVGATAVSPLLWGGTMTGAIGLAGLATSYFFKPNLKSRGEELPLLSSSAQQSMGV